MADLNRTFFITEHVHFDQDGDLRFCETLRDRVDKVLSKGFDRAEVYFKMNADGSIDTDDAMHIFWKGKKNAWNVE